MTTSASQDEVGQVRVLQDGRGRRTAYEELEIGKDLGSAEYIVTQPQIDQMCERLGDHHPYFQLASPFGSTVAPVYMTYKLTRALFSQTYSVRGLFYKWAFEFLQPVRVNARHTVKAVLTDKWIRNDREFVAYESECRNEAGELVFRTRRAHVLDFIKRTAPKVGVGIDSSDARSPEGKAAREEFWDPEWESHITAAGTGNIEVQPLATRDTQPGALLPSMACHFSEREFEKRWGWAKRRADGNTTVHFAGGLGKPAWTLVPDGHGAHWYWFRDRADSPWYPTMKLFRQTAPGQWAPALADAAAALKAWTT